MHDDVITIPLTQGKSTIIDSVDAHLLAGRRWYAAYINGHWYAIATSKKRTFYLHRVIADAPKGMLVDHENGNGLDNRRLNLRVCTRSQNTANRHRISRPPASGYFGVRRIPRSPNAQFPWHATIVINQKWIKIGAFSTAMEAAKAYDAEARKHFGEFATLNFSDDSDHSGLLAA